MNVPSKANASTLRGTNALQYYDLDIPVVNYIPIIRVILLAEVGREEEGCVTSVNVPTASRQLTHSQ